MRQTSIIQETQFGLENAWTILIVIRLDKDGTADLNNVETFLDKYSPSLYYYTQKTEVNKLHRYNSRPQQYTDI